MEGKTDLEVMPFGARIYYSREILLTPPAQSSPFDWGGLGPWDTTSFATAGRMEILDGQPSDPSSPFPFKECRYCGGPLTHHLEAQMYKIRDWRRADAIQCQRCEWWLYAWSKNASHLRGTFRNQIWESAVHAFDYEPAEAPIAALRTQVSRHNVDLRSITPTELERLVTSVFRDYFGCTATHVGGSADGGIDILLLDRDPPLAIQVKRRATPATEGPAVVRELVGALALRGWRRGALVTTAESFSKQAQETVSAEPLALDGYEIDLYAHDALRSIVTSTTQPPRPWLDLIYDHYLSPDDLALKRKRESVGKTQSARHVTGDDRADQQHRSGG